MFGNVRHHINRKIPLPRAQGPLLDFDSHSPGTRFLPLFSGSDSMNRHFARRSRFSQKGSGLGLPGSKFFFFHNRRARNGGGVHITNQGRGIVSLLNETTPPPSPSLNLIALCPGTVHLGLPGGVSLFLPPFRRFHPRVGVLLPSPCPGVSSSTWWIPRHCLVWSWPD